MILVTITLVYLCVSKYLIFKMTNFMKVIVLIDIALAGGFNTPLQAKLKLMNVCAGETVKRIQYLPCTRLTQVLFLALNMACRACQVLAMSNPFLQKKLLPIMESYVRRDMHITVHLNISTIKIQYMHITKSIHSSQIFKICFGYLLICFFLQVIRIHSYPNF